MVSEHANVLMDTITFSSSLNPDTISPEKFDFINNEKQLSLLGKFQFDGFSGLALKEGLDSINHFIQIEFDFKSDSFTNYDETSDYRFLIGRYSSNDGEYGLKIYYNQNIVGFAVGGGKNNSLQVLKFDIPDQKFLMKWHHLKAIYGIEGTMELSLDGISSDVRLDILSESNNDWVMLKWHRNTRWTIGVLEELGEQNVVFSHFHIGEIRNLKINGL
ncbi:MAG: hypothetical protein H6607_12470 [Flavobacteriales bacterium]|nr:hypothetical protein [Flavobacteriales bacterium]